MIAPNELALLEESCATLTARLNPAQRITALMALKTLSLRGAGGDQMRLRMLEWAEAVATGSAMNQRFRG